MLSEKVIVMYFICILAKIPMKRKEYHQYRSIVLVQSKKDKDGFVIKFINNFIGIGGLLARIWREFVNLKEGLATEKKYKTRSLSRILLIFCLTVEEKNTAKDLELHAELRYSYGEGLSLPWRQEVNVVKIEVANSLEVLNNFNTTEKFMSAVNQDLAEAVLAQVILFNRKRSGEAQRMKLEHFKNAAKKSLTPPDKEILNKLTKFVYQCLESRNKGKKG
ncbi:hypothetical protein KUTeg_015101 [Tegillarca granosa]|uniref:Uncharacterized protein n=1 Tax=Tegillarca granosa TaxID=220873 RepID=A0ABQ9ETV7_TEGGR|nr:hypothetical protein KUTeg_015101 [Tegillarca granosa]